jgi:hypothetical protein
MTTEEVAVDVKTPFAHFIKVIKGEEEPSYSGFDGSAALIVCNALKQSLETDILIDVEQPI